VGYPFMADYKKGPLCHYLIFGGDNNVEVLTCNKPKIKEIDKEIMIKLNYKV
jgi:hypothetical protein